MMLDKLRETNSVIQTSLTHKQNEAAIREFENQLLNLKSVVSSLNSRLILTEELTKRKLTSPFVPESTRNTIQEAIDQCGSKTENKTLDIAAVTALKGASELLKNLTDTVWKNVAEKRYSKTINMLQLFINLVTSQKEATELIEALNKARTQPPGNVTAIDKIEEKLQKAENLINQLNVSDDPEIVSFLGKVKERQATIIDLSPKILDWLKSNHLSGKIKLSF